MDKKYHEFVWCGMVLSSNCTVVVVAAKGGDFRSHLLLLLSWKITEWKMLVTRFIYFYIYFNFSFLYFLFVFVCFWFILSLHIRFFFYSSFVVLLSFQQKVFVGFYLQTRLFFMCQTLTFMSFVKENKRFFFFLWVEFTLRFISFRCFFFFFL